MDPIKELAGALTRGPDGSRNALEFLMCGACPQEKFPLRMRSVSLVPVLEAVGHQIESLLPQAFDEQGEILDLVALIHIQGLITFLGDIMDGLIPVLIETEIPINGFSMALIQLSLGEIDPLVRKAVAAMKQ